MFFGRRRYHNCVEKQKFAAGFAISPRPLWAAKGRFQIRVEFYFVKNYSHRISARGSVDLRSRRAVLAAIALAALGPQKGVAQRAAG